LHSVLFRVNDRGINRYRNRSPSTEAGQALASVVVVYVDPLDSNTSALRSITLMPNNAFKWTACRSRPVFRQPFLCAAT
jgi:hypothetical protein